MTAEAVLFDTPRGKIEIREVQGVTEMIAAEKIQQAVWGWEAIPHPKEILIPIQHEGGLLVGAFGPAGEMVGMVFGFPTRQVDVQHSQLLATLPEWRGCGIGARLKWFQRAWCLERGIQHVRWTVDPLRAANAELNIRHLGGIASTYYNDYYGAMQGIDAGAPTDRLLIEWDLGHPRVAALTNRLPEDTGFPNAIPLNRVQNGKPEGVKVEPGMPQVLLRLPVDFVEIARGDPALALEWRIQTRAIFQGYFSMGYSVTGFTRQGGPAYLLER
jgi:chorismate synthase